MKIKRDGHVYGDRVNAYANDEWEYQLILRGRGSPRIANRR